MYVKWKILQNQNKHNFDKKTNKKYQHIPLV